jgi:hypothetical protein
MATIKLHTADTRKSANSTHPNSVRHTSARRREITAAAAAKMAPRKANLAVPGLKDWMLTPPDVPTYIGIISTGSLAGQLDHATYCLGSFPPAADLVRPQVGSVLDGSRVAVRALDSLPVLARMWHGLPVADRQSTVKMRLTPGQVGGPVAES